VPKRDVLGVDTAFPERRIGLLSTRKNEACTFHLFHYLDELSFRCLSLSKETKMVQR